jgi:uncharacterized protein
MASSIAAPGEYDQGRFVDVSFSVLILTALVFLLAGFTKGVIGLGLPTVSMGLLVLTMTPARAAALLVVPSLITNVWQMAAGPSLWPLLRRLWPMMVGIAGGTWLAAGVLSISEADAATTGLGIALVLYSLMGLMSVRLHIPEWAEPWLAPLIGATTGAITAWTGVFVIPAVPYLQAIGLEKDDLVQALGLSFTVSTLALAGVLAWSGSFPVSVAAESLFALVPALVGMITGQWIRGHVRPDVFRRWFFIGLLLLGAHLALRAAL